MQIHEEINVQNNLFPLRTQDKNTLQVLYKLYAPTVIPIPCTTYIYASHKPNSYKLVKEQSIYSLVKFEVLYGCSGWILVLVTEQ